jgi:nitroreductase
MDAIEAIHGRRSVRAYRPERLERAHIEEVMWAAVQAPTPPVSGETPWAFCVIEGAQSPGESVGWGLSCLPSTQHLRLAFVRRIKEYS